MPFVNAQCTNCNAPLEVDDSKEAAICPYCGTPYIVEKAIQQFNVTNNNTFLGANIVIEVEAQNLLQKGAAHIKLGELNEALDTYLKLTIEYPQVQEGWIQLIKTRIAIDRNKMQEFSVIPDLLGEIPEYKKAERLLNDSQIRQLETEYNKYLLEIKNYSSIYKKKEIAPFFEKFESTDSLNEWLKKNKKRLIAYEKKRVLTHDEGLYFIIMPSEKLCFRVGSTDSHPIYGEYIDEFGIDSWNAATGEININIAGIRTTVKRDSERKKRTEASVKKIIIKKFSENHSLCANYRYYSERSDGMLYCTLVFDDQEINTYFFLDDYIEEKKGCYIATCVYGSYDCPEVWTLRRYRDYVLDKTWYGRMFIKCYYAVSPKLVIKYGNQKLFKVMWRNILNKLVKLCQMKGIENTPYVDKY